MIVALAVAALALAGFAPERPHLVGQATRIVDGDTFVLTTARGGSIRVRLAEIDAPEHGQPWASPAKRGLAALILDRKVVVAVGGRDRYGRTLGHVRVQAVDVNATMVRRGDAWAFRAYLNDHRLLALEREARRGRRGLWTLPVDQQIPPWAWRHVDSAMTRARNAVVFRAAPAVRPFHVSGGPPRKPFATVGRPAPLARLPCGAANPAMHGTSTVTMTG